jgi:hypothetical protein
VRLVRFEARELRRGDAGAGQRGEAAQLRKVCHRGSLKRKGQPCGWPYLLESSRNSLYGL